MFVSSTGVSTIVEQFVKPVDVSGKYCAALHRFDFSDQLVEIVVASERPMNGVHWISELSAFPFADIVQR